MLERVTIFKIVRHTGPKIVCRQCEAIVQAPISTLPIERGPLGLGLLAHGQWPKWPATCRSTASPKSMPRRRLVQLLAPGRLGMMGAALLTPLAKAIGKHVEAESPRHADGALVPILAPGLAKTATGCVWVGAGAHGQHQADRSRHTLPCWTRRRPPDERASRNPLGRPFLTVLGETAAARREPNRLR